KLPGSFGCRRAVQAVHVAIHDLAQHWPKPARPRIGFRPVRILRLTASSRNISLCAVLVRHPAHDHRANRERLPRVRRARVYDHGPDQVELLRRKRLRITTAAQASAVAKLSRAAWTVSSISAGV